MRRELLTKQLREEFRDVLSTFVLREINEIFEAGGLEPDLDFISQASGQRRSLVDQYYANIDFTNRGDIVKLLRAFEELFYRLGPKAEADKYAKDQIERLNRRMNHDGLTMQNGHFIMDSLPQVDLTIPSKIELTSTSIAEHVEKARIKIVAKDCAGAITNAYTLVEEFLKAMLRRAQVDFKESEGDIRALYALVSDALNLNPKGENLDGYLRTILQGLKSIIAGLYDVANKASDRHARKYNPAEHHAKLAVNAALAVCEFLLDSYEYQHNLKTKRPRHEQEAEAARK
jgi:HEPN domain-containing protein